MTATTTLQLVQEHGFTTSDWFQLAVAIATLLLAGVTAWMAIETRRVASSSLDETKAVRDEIDVARQQVEATNRQAEAAADAVRTSVRPVLVEVPEVEVAPEEVVSFANIGAQQRSRGPDWAIRMAVPERPDWFDKALISVPLRNVGPGAAIISRVRPRALGDDHHEVAAVPTKQVVPQGETVRLNLNPWAGVNQLRVEVTYTDVSGDQLARTRLLIQRADVGNDWRVAGQAVHFDDGSAVWAGEGWDPATGEEVGSTAYPVTAPTDSLPSNEPGEDRRPGH